MKKSRTLWHIFLLLLYPAAEEVAASGEGGSIAIVPPESMEVAFGEAFSVTCRVKNGTVPEWSFNGGQELPDDASVNEAESGGDEDEGTVTYRLEVPAANLDNVGAYRDGRLQWRFQKFKSDGARAEITP